MLKKTRTSSAQSLSKKEEPIVPDPWEQTNSVLDINKIPSYKIPNEAHPLLSPGGNPSALRLSAPKKTSEAKN